MCLDIEHFIKVYLLTMIENNSKEDGYYIVDEFLKYIDENSKNKIIGNIVRNIGNPYCGELIQKYNITKDTKELTDFPIWAFIEIISFGQLRELYKFYHDLYSVTDSNDTIFLLQTVNQIRNAAAHSNCIINNLEPIHPDGVEFHEANYYVKEFLSNAGIGKSSRASKMNNPRSKTNCINYLCF